MRSVLVVPRTPCVLCGSRAQADVDMTAHDRSEDWPRGRFFTCRRCNPDGRKIVKYDDL